MTSRIGRSLEVATNALLAASALAVIILVLIPKLRSNSPQSVAQARARVLTEEQKSELDSLVSSIETGLRPEVVVFIDVECPFCARYSATLDSVLNLRPNTTITYLHFPLNQHQFALPGALMLECVRSEGRLPAALALGYGAQDTLSKVSWGTLVSQAGVKLETPLESCTNSEAVRRSVDRQKEVGVSVGVSGTPGVIVGTTVFAIPPGAREIIEALDKT